MSPPVKNLKNGRHHPLGAIGIPNSRRWRSSGGQVKMETLRKLCIHSLGNMEVSDVILCVTLYAKGRDQYISRPPRIPGFAVVAPREPQ